MPRCLFRSLVVCVLVFLGGRFGFFDAQAQPLVINEIVSSNANGLQDEDGDRPDWIELYNTFPIATSTAGYGLSDSAAEPFKWRVPSFVLPAHGYLLVFASGKDRTNVATRLHSNFSIQASGERLFLTPPGGGATQIFPSRALRRDGAFGRFPNGSTNLYFLPRPTPRASNVGPGFATALRPPVFSENGGFFGARFPVGVSSPDDGVVIRYTLDGSEPTETTEVYTEPLVLRDRSRDPNILSMIPRTSIANQHTDGWFPPATVIPKATGVRVKVFRPDALPSETVTRTWFIGTNSPGRHGLPVVSINTDTNGLFDYVRGIYVLGKLFDDYRAAHPGEALTGHSPANYQARGAAWERTGHLEYFRPDGTLEMAHEVSLEIQGQSSRSFRQKSLGVRALGSDFAGELFPGYTARGTGELLTQFAKLRLANSGNDWAYTLLRDPLSHTLVRDLPLDLLAYRPCLVYLDGEYWGIHALREQQDGTWIASHYGVDRSSVVLCEGQGFLLEGKAGEEQEFVQLREFIRTNNLASDAVAAAVSATMDVDNFLLYQAVEIILGNADWPQNNIRYWRKRVSSLPAETVPVGHDGRWRWMLQDTDLALAHPWSAGVTENTLAAVTNPSGRPGLDAPWSTVMLRQLLKNRTFRDRFINRLGDLLNAHFREARAVSVLNSLVAEIEPAIPEHIDRWRSMDGSVAGWKTRVQAIRSFLSQRPTQVRQHVVNYFSLGAYHALTLNVQPSSAGEITVNSLALEPGTPGVVPEQPYPWRGYYFRGVPVQLEAIAAAGWRFVGWTGMTNSEADRVDIALTALGEMVAHFEPAPARIAGWSADAASERSLAFEGIADSEYRVQASGNLIDWEDRELAPTGADGKGRVVVRVTDEERGRAVFYRLVVR